MSMMSGLIALVVVVGLFAALAGANLSDTDLLNFNTSAATARARDQETQADAGKATIDLQNYQAIEDARTQAELAKQQQTLDHNQRELDLKLELERQRGEQALELERRQAEQDRELARAANGMALTAGCAAALILSTGLTVRMLRKSQPSAAPAPSAVAPPPDPWPWHDRAWRAERILEARHNELALRRAKWAAEPPGNGQHPPNEIEHESSREID